MIIYVPKGARVFIVEDNQERIDWFQKKLEPIVSMLAITKDPDKAIVYLGAYEDFDAVFLDHDLGIPGFEPTIRSTVIWMAANIPDLRRWSRCVVIHSWNEPGAAWMRQALPGATVAPFGSFDIKEQRW